MVNINKIENLIKENGWSNSYFSSLFDKNSGWVKDWKRGRGIPDVNLLQAIAAKLGTTVEYLTDQTDIKNKPTVEIDSRLNENLLVLEKMTQDFTPEEWAKLIDHAELLLAAQKRSKQ